MPVEVVDCKQEIISQKSGSAGYQNRRSAELRGFLGYPLCDCLYVFLKYSVCHYYISLYFFVCLSKFSAFLSSSVVRFSITESSRNLMACAIIGGVVIRHFASTITFSTSASSPFLKS